MENHCLSSNSNNCGHDPLIEMKTGVGVRINKLFILKDDKYLPEYT